jgi:hypothetical protein
MGEIDRVDSFAMENRPEQEEDSVTAIDLHYESAQLWAGSIVDRLEVWAQRAHRIAVALERHQTRR